jgi:hypothetical protein
MSHMPLVLIPAFLVPLFVMLHLTALFQWRQARRAQPQSSRTYAGSTAVAFR